MDFPELDQKKILEIFLGLILIILLVLLVFTITNQTKSTTQPSTTITNSFNTYNIEYSEPTYQEIKYQTDSTNSQESFSNYSSRSEHQVSTGMFGNEINRYIVYIKNKNNAGYFIVTFDFDDDKSTSSITRYIKTNQEIKFTYTDINDKYSNWDYKINVI